MSRVKVFTPDPAKPTKQRSLRHNAREAAEYLTGLPYEQPPSPDFGVYKKPGRGPNGESSN
jgi:hypothetical protein